jgi:hypothetical protein
VYVPSSRVEIYPRVFRHRNSGSIDEHAADDNHCFLARIYSAHDQHDRFLAMALSRSIVRGQGICYLVSSKSRYIVF